MKGEGKEMSIAGWNGGNHYTKVVMDSKEVILPSYIAPGRERSLETYTDTHLDDLDITYEKQRYFVGKLAKSYPAEMQVAYGKEKGGDFNTRLCLLAATAYLAEKKNISVRPVSCLPVVDYKTQKEEFAKNLEGVHILQLPFKKVTIEVRNPLIVPEGGCAAWDLILDDKGNEVLTYIDKHIAIVDVGSRTTNIAVLNKQVYQPQLSDTYPAGMWDVYDAASLEIKAKKDVAQHEVEDNLHLVKDIGQHYNNLAKSLANKIKMGCWKSDPKFDFIILCGGSAPAILPYFQQYYAQTILHPRPQMANAWGAYKIGMVEGE